MLRKLVLAALAALLLSAHAMAFAIEEPAFVVTRQLADGVVVRDYAPYIAAEVLVPGPAADAGRQGFERLAPYIFGRNQGERKIAMTAPVMQTPSAAEAEPAAAAAVTQTAAEGGFTVRFVMPAASTLETLPPPTDPAVRLTAVPGARVAVITYSGFWSESNYETHLAALRKTLEAENVKTAGPPVYARYDPPWTPWFMRRNEIWLPLEP